MKYYISNLLIIIKHTQVLSIFFIRLIRYNKYLIILDVYNHKKGIIMWGVMVLSYILTAISFILIIATALSGYFQLSIFNSNHITIALFSSITYMFTETMILFYFITVGMKIKEIIKNNNLDIVKYYKPILDMKMKLYPHIMLNMIVMGTTFIIGGGVHTGAISINIHSLCFFIAVIHFLWLVFLQHRCFIKNTEVVILVYDLVKGN